MEKRPPKRNNFAADSQNPLLMKNRLYIFAVLSLMVASCKIKGIERNGNAANAMLHIDPVRQELVIDLREALEHQGKSGLVEVNIQHDHYFKKAKKYLGYDLQAMLNSIIQSNRLDTAGMIMVFDCTDGYKPEMSVSKAFMGVKGFLAIKDQEATGDKSWTDSLDAVFSPYYLVWQNVEPSDHRFPWPYGLTKIRLIPAATQYKTIYPFKNPEMVKGFNLFRDNCNKCHALNHVGGKMGPEFNIPKNITEYWKEEDIIGFALNPKSYRASSLMPPMENILSMEEIKAIVGYLKFMSTQKIVD